MDTGIILALGAFTIVSGLINLMIAHPINKRIDDINKRIDDTNKRIDDTNKRIDDTNKHINELRAETKDDMRAINTKLDNIVQMIVFGKYAPPRVEPQMAVEEESDKPYS